MTGKIMAGVPSAETIDYLLHRRSTPVKLLTAPGPGRTQIETILSAAARVPDHGKLFPWYFIVIEGEARHAAGEILAGVYARENPDAPAEKVAQERGKFLRAPVTIAVVSRLREGKPPVWEQILSAGAACQNLCLAANAFGYGSNWITEWYAFNDSVKKAFGLDARDHFAGFVLLGTAESTPEERERPDIGALTTFWEKGAELRKGDMYGRRGMGYPPSGFDFSGLGTPE